MYIYTSIYIHLYTQLIVEITQYNSNRNVNNDNDDDDGKSNIVDIILSITIDVFRHSEDNRIRKT